MYRAHESERPNPLFRDPFARRLAGERGEQILRQFRNQARHEWAYVARTWLFDSFVRERVAEGVDMVINLAAGLDTRPYRMELPSSLRWIEIDLPELLAYKESILSNEAPVCRLERISADLSDATTRRAIFERLGAEARKVLVLSEGLLIYLGADGASGLAQDLAAQKSFRWWVFDIASPALMKMLQKQIGQQLDRANATLRFGPAEGPWFFENLGWRVLDVRGSLKSAAKVMKLPLLLRFFSLFPEQPRNGKGFWAGTCLLENKESA
jgi:methyltransferase (TIGR00027 family)